MEDLLNEIKHRDCTSLRYEKVSQWEVGKALIDDAVDAWESLGFFDGIEDEEKKRQLAIAFDNVTYDLLKEDDRIVDIKDKYEENCDYLLFDVAVYAILRRIICGNDFDKGTDKFQYDKFLYYLERLSFLAVNDDDYEYEVDVEAEYVAIISKLIVELFENEK